MSDNADAAARALISSDDVVQARWSVAVLPGESASIHYAVSPKSQDDAVTSVTASFVLMQDQVVLRNFAGSTTAELISPKDGQGMTGDVGVDASVFPEKHEGELAAVLSGTARHEGQTVNFFFKREFTPF